MISGAYEKRGPAVRLEKVTLENDHGADIVFRGYQYAQTSFYEGTSGVLTKQELYATEDGHEAFSIVSSDGNFKSKRAYLIRREEEFCRIFNGDKELIVPLDWLILFAQVLWKLDEEKVAGGWGEKSGERLKSVNE